MPFRGDMKILLKIAYDGSRFQGFQFQPQVRTVQSVLTETVSSVMGIPCNVTGCSRTDSGVHATGFCAAISPVSAEPEGWCRIPVSKLHRPLNEKLPLDLSVLAAASVPDDFHPRYSVVSKTYEYRIYTGLPRDPFMENRTFHALPITAEGKEHMRSAANLFIGKHDFASFMAVGSKIKETYRTVYSSSIGEKNQLLVFRVSADGFLYNMVRIMVGSLLDVAYGRMTEERIIKALNLHNRTLAGFTAPPHGLYLTDVCYDRQINWECD